MNNTYGYIYIRNQDNYDTYNVYKLGKTYNIAERNRQYLTNEFVGGYYIIVFEVISNKLDEIELNLKKDFNYLNMRVDGGIEFFDRQIKDLIEPYLISNNYKYRILNKEEIDNFLRVDRNDRNYIDEPYELNDDSYSDDSYSSYSSIKTNLDGSNTDSYTSFETNQTSDLKDEQESEQESEPESDIEPEPESDIEPEQESDIEHEQESEQKHDITHEQESDIKPEQNGEQEFKRPRDYQNDIIEKCAKYFKEYDKGILVLPCGTGKTLTSLWIAEKLNSNTIVIGVPNKLLLMQWEKDVNDLFKDIKAYLVDKNINKNDIKTFLLNKTKCVVITTYASSYKVAEAIKEMSFTFDIKINDECHHLTCLTNDSNKKQYIKMLDIKSRKQLSLTATIKEIESLKKNDSIISNDDIEHFGDIIDKKSLLWAIDKSIICNYTIQTIIANKEEIEKYLTKHDITDENQQRLFLSVFISLRSIHDGFSNHILIYSNNTDNSSYILKCIKSILTDNLFDDFFNSYNLYCSEYHGNMNGYIKGEIIKDFKKYKYGIISCVYCLGEGWDCPLLDSVVFAENMTSDIRIVQSALRPIRKNADQPNKVAKIILPFFGTSADFRINSDNPDFKKVREVIIKMGQEDETIFQKIVVCNISLEKSKNPKNPKTPDKSLNILGEYDKELTEHIKINVIKREHLGISEITYEKAKKRIAKKNVKSKAEYRALCLEDIQLPIDPNITFKTQFKGWIDYLNIGRKYYDLVECKKKVNAYIANNNDIKIHYLELSVIVSKLCKFDKLFPPNDLWIEYYDITNLEDIIYINHKKKKIV